MGMMGYRIPLGSGNKKGKAQNLRRLIAPLSELQIIAEHREGRALQEIKEAEHARIRLNLLSHPVKLSIAHFLSEVLTHILRDIPGEEELFAYITHSLDVLEECHLGTANFHLTFLYHLLDFVGIAPSQYHSHFPRGWFDLAEARFVERAPLSPCIPPEEVYFLPTFQRITYKNMSVFHFSVTERRRILNYLLTYYSLHFAHVGQLSSPEVLSLL
ncbi:DNA repair protein RecO (recombination protein O) [Porphyromonas circumdentaria]|nr:DNA repair protein RecO (recombination protein O) [Porphyromonas circumdentaria]